MKFSEFASAEYLKSSSPGQRCSGRRFKVHLNRVQSFLECAKNTISIKLRRSLYGEGLDHRLAGASR